MRRPGGPNTVEAWIVVVGLVALWLMLGWRLLDWARSHDFLEFYTGAYMTSHGRVADYYDPAVQLATQKEFASATEELTPFLRPPFYAILLTPLGWLPLRAAFVCWILLQIALLIACLTWAWRRFGTSALMFGCMSMPAALGIAHGQDCVLFLAVLIASYTLAEKGMELASGTVLALLLVKFHFAPLWLLMLIVQRRWRMLAGFAAAGAAATAVSLALIGVNGVRAYAALLQNPDLVRLSPEFMISFQGLAANLGVTSALAYAAAILGIVALFLASVWHAPLWRAYTASTAASLLLPPHAYGYDAAMLLLGLWLAMSHAGLSRTRVVTLWLFTPLPFSFTLAGKPWAAVSSLSLLAMLVALAGEAGHLRRTQTIERVAAVDLPHA